MGSRFSENRLVLFGLIILSTLVAAWMVVSHAGLGPQGFVGYLLKLVLVAWGIFMVLFALLQLLAFAVRRASASRPAARQTVIRRRTRIKDIRQIDLMAPDDWFALPYNKRVESAREFLRREYPQEFAGFASPVFVLLEDATETQLRRWQEEGTTPYQPVTTGMMTAAPGIVERGKGEVHAADALKAAGLARRKAAQ
jgi:hypothetical protein